MHFRRRETQLRWVRDLLSPLLRDHPSPDAHLLHGFPFVYSFLVDNRDELIARCRSRVASRTGRNEESVDLARGVPLFLEQVIGTLRAETVESGREGRQGDESFRISGASLGDPLTQSEIGMTASEHGKDLLDLGYSVDDVVHDYGDLCQAITDLAIERDIPCTLDEFRTLNRCLDNAIADAVTAFTQHRERAIAHQTSVDEIQRLGFIVHELRNYLQTATLAFGALESGKLGISGSTAFLVKRSHESMASLLTDAISGVRSSATRSVHEPFPLKTMVDDATLAATLPARENGSTLTVGDVDASLLVRGNRIQLTAALVNLLQNAFKFTRPQTEVVLRTYRGKDRVVIEVRDHCGGLPPGAAERVFSPFQQAGPDRSGLGLGLSIARQSVEADGGWLRVTDLPGIGCVFSIDLPLALQR